MMSKNLDVKIELAIPGKNSVLKRVAKPENYQVLTEQARAMCSKAGYPQASFVVTYRDADNEPVVVEDNDDLQMAFAIAESLGQPPKIKFLLQVSADEQPKASIEENKDEPMAEEEEFHIKTKCKKNKGAAKGIPRKALKNLIQTELKKQSEEVFQDLIKQKDIEGLPDTEDEVLNEDDQKVIHHHVECDGCGVCPIEGVRYKCSVRKNFDYCSNCEERMPHEYPMLKIRQSNGAPDTMITMLNEDAPTFQPQAEMRGGCRGRGGRGMRGGRGGCFRGGAKGGLGQMINKYLQKREIDNGVAEEMARQFLENKGLGEYAETGQEGGFGTMVTGLLSKMGMDAEKLAPMAKMMAECHENKGQGQGQSPWNCSGGKNWNALRAQVVSKPEGILEASPDSLLTPAIEIHNGTFWPWKQGCYLSLDDDNVIEDLPIEFIKVPVDQEVKGKENFKMQIPLKILPHVVAEDKIHTINLSFSGPNGFKFGEKISIQLRITLPSDEYDELALYKMAIKMTEQNVGTFDECTAALRIVGLDEAKALEVLKQRKD